jgi:hypothetical protein
MDSILFSLCVLSAISFVISSTVVAIIEKDFRLLCRSFAMWELRDRQRKNPKKKLIKPLKAAKYSKIALAISIALFAIFTFYDELLRDILL